MKGGAAVEFASGKVVGYCSIHSGYCSQVILSLMLIHQCILLVMSFAVNGFFADHICSSRVNLNYKEFCNYGTATSNECCLECYIYASRWSWWSSLERHHLWTVAAVVISHFPLRSPNFKFHQRVISDVLAYQWHILIVANCYYYVP